MIVVDTNILAYLLITGDRTAVAKAVLHADPVWAMPLLGRSEFRNVVALYLRNSLMSWAEAKDAIISAEQLLAGQEYAVSSLDVLELTRSSACSSYDCEFVALAQELNVPLITADRRILREFPGIAITPEVFTQ